VIVNLSRRKREDLRCPTADNSKKRAAQPSPRSLGRAGRFRPDGAARVLLRLGVLVLLP
jgi:hypothetical protein